MVIICPPKHGSVAGIDLGKVANFEECHAEMVAANPIETGEGLASISPQRHRDTEDADQGGTEEIH